MGYLSPSDVANNNLATEAMCKSLQLAAAEGLPLVLVGDFNLRHPDWLDFNAGGNTTPPQVLASYISTSSLTVLNAVLMPGQVTRPTDRADGAAGSIIDLAITNAPHLVVSMDTDHSHSLDSDHYPVTMTMDLKPQQPPAPDYDRPRKQWSVRRHVERWQRELPLALDAALAHWPLPLLSHPLPLDPLAATVAAQGAIDTAYASLEATLLSCLEQTVGTHQTSIKSKAWFAVPGVRSAYDRMKAARRIWKHSRTPNLLKRRAAADAMAEWKDTVVKAKSTAWAAMCCSIQDDPKSTLKWTVFKRSRGSDRSSLGSFPNGNGTAPAHLGESLDNLCSHFVASSVPPPLSPSHVDLDLDSRYLLPRLPSSPSFRASALAPHVSDSWTFSPEDVKQQCTTQNTNSAPGCDTILPILLRHIGASAYRALSAVFTFSWQHGVLPQQWTEANVMALWKGKGNRADPASFRPISMTSILIRTFEHLIHRPLSALLEENHVLHPLQFGFRKGHSTLDAINYLQSNTRDMFPTSHQMPCPTLFLDLVKAFDRVWPTRLMQYVEHAGITGRAWRWLYAFVTRRRIRTVDANHQSRWQPLTYGVPQGAVLSPLLFNLFINPIAKRIATTCPRLNLQLYADDMVIQPRAAKLVNGVPPAPRPGPPPRGWHSLQRGPGPCLPTAELVVRGDADGALAKTKHNGWCSTRVRGLSLPRTSPAISSTASVASHPRWWRSTSTWVSLTIASWNGTRRASRPYNASAETATSSPVSSILLAHPTSRPSEPCALAMSAPAACTHGHSGSPSPLRYAPCRPPSIQPMQRVLGLHSSSHHLGLLAEAHCPSFEALRTQARSSLPPPEQRICCKPTLATPLPVLLCWIAPRAAAYHCRGHTKSGITVTNFAEATAIPHLIHNVFTRLPALAPLHPLTACYFPSQPVASTPPLPTSLTIDQVNSLLMVDTHREWRAPPTLRGVSISTAPLLTIKTSPALSLYLRVRSATPWWASELVSEPTAPTSQFRRYTLRQATRPLLHLSCLQATRPVPPRHH